jgi:hypothetical protein
VELLHKAGDDFAADDLLLAAAEQLDKARRYGPLADARSTEVMAPDFYSEADAERSINAALIILLAVYSELYE